MAAKSYEEWARSPGIYADYGDYLKGERATRDYYARLDRERLAEEVARRVVDMQREERSC